MPDKDPPRIEDLLPQLSWDIQTRFEGLSRLGMLRHLLMTIFRTFAFEVAFPANPAGQLRPILMFQSMPRKDYNELFQNVVKSLGEDATAVSLDAQAVYSNRPKAFRSLGLAGVVRRTGLVFRLMHRHRRMFYDALRRYGVSKGAWLCLQVLKIEPGLTQLLDHRPKGVVVFAEMQCIDRMLTWLCADRGIPCGTLQHGLYAEYTREETVNVHNYQPKYVSDFFAWGEMTAQLISKYCQEVRVTVCGKPVERIPESDQDLDSVFACVVIMDQNIFEAQNIEMLTMVKKAFSDMAKPLGLRMHPQNDIKRYDLTGFEEVTTENWRLTECIVGHTTSFLIDLIQDGFTLYRYASACESVFQNSDIEFTTVEELVELRTKRLPLPQSLVKAYISQTGEDAARAHAEAIRNYLKT